MKNVVVTVNKDKKKLSIFIDGLLHLYISGKIVAIHSWIDKDKEKDMFYIQYSTKEKDILTKYMKRKVWEKILSKLCLVL